MRKFRVYLLCEKYFLLLLSKVYISKEIYSLNQNELDDQFITKVKFLKGP